MNKNKTNTNKGKKTQGKGRTRSNDRYSNGERPSTNDVSWYNTNPDITNAAAALNFSRPLGVPFARGMNTANLSFAGTTIETDGYENAVPGIMTMGLLPSVGFTDRPTDALNMASTAIYSFVRHANSGHANYDSPDLTLYLMANTQVYAYLNFLLRVYRSATLYSGMNRYLPKALCYAQGVDYNDVVRNLANFRYQIDSLILKAQSLAVPAQMSIFARHAFLYSNVYAEGTSPKDQLYMYNPRGFWRFTLDDDGAGMLETVPFRGTNMTVDQLIQFGTDMLDRLITDEDMGIMSGDILKAYGIDGILKLNTISDLQPLVPIFDPIVLRQFKNAKVFPYETDFGDMAQWFDASIEQSEDKSYLVSMPRLKVSSHDQGNAMYGKLVTAIFAHSASPLISASGEVPTVDEVLEITRLTTCFGNAYYVGNTSYFPIICASEIPVDCRIWTTDDAGNTVDVWLFSTGELVTEGSDVARQELYTLLSNFKYAPEVMLINPKSSSGTVSYYGSYYDMDNYTIEDAQTIDRIHDAVLMNMLAVPSVASFSTVKRSV